MGVNGALAADLFGQLPIAAQDEILQLMREAARKPQQPVNEATPGGTARTLASLRGNRTQAEVAAAIGISTAALAAYEAGRRIPRDEIKTVLAHYYSLPLDELFSMLPRRVECGCAL